MTTSASETLDEGPVCVKGVLKQIKRFEPQKEILNTRSTNAETCQRF